MKKLFLPTINMVSFFGNMPRNVIQKATTLLLVLFVALNSYGQTTVTASQLTQDHIQYWIGTGAKKAILIVHWTPQNTAVAWGYKWDDSGTESTKVAQMINAINSADSKLTVDGLESYVSEITYNHDSVVLNGASNGGSGWLYGVNNTMASAIAEQSLNDGDIVYFKCYTDNFDIVVPSDLEITIAPAPVAAFNNGVFFVNEDWFGHNNSSINFLDTGGNWQYRVYRTVNQGKELGATSQYGTIYGDKLFIVSKQAKDGGATIQGSRLAVCNAVTMNSLAEFTTIGGADGRSFLGVDEHKGYIATSSGIYLFDIDNLTIGSQLEGTGNETGSLYLGQIGTMVRAADKVFAVNQQKGLLVINTETDQVETIINAPLEEGTQRGFGSVVLSKDGNLWLSVAESTNGDGKSVEYIIKLNPQTLDTTRVVLPQGMGVPNSWYAWTADGFCSSTQNNKIYWKNSAGWSNSTKIYEYDIDNNIASTVIDLATYEPSERWGIYGAGFRLDPATDDIYVSLFKTFGDQTYKVVKIDINSGTVTASYPMTPHYWFPAMPVFPDNNAPVVSDSLTNLSIDRETKVYLNDKVEDSDNMSVAVVKTIVSVSNDNLITAKIVNDSLIVAPKDNQFGSSVVEIKFNSNGKIVTKAITVTVVPVGLGSTENNRIQIFPTVTSGQINIVQASSIEKVQILDVSGKLLQTFYPNASNATVDISSYRSGVYFVKVGNSIAKVIKQ